MSHNDLRDRTDYFSLGTRSEPGRNAPKVVTLGRGAEPTTATEQEIAATSAFQKRANVIESVLTKGSTKARHYAKLYKDLS